jgi:glycosyltransferase involved in cell wall biosynthesis
VSGAVLPSVQRPYLLVTNIPIWIGEDGARRIDPLWYKDLVGHTAYLPDLRVAAPLRRGGDPQSMRDIADLPIEFIELPSGASLAQALLQLPWSLSRLWGAVRGADVVHTGIAGWPIPLGWLAGPLARAQGKYLITVVESAPWRTDRGSLKKAAGAMVHEALARFWVRRTNIAFFTQREYRSEFLGADDARGHVIHASWIDDDWVLDRAAAERAWDQKASAGRVRMFFAGQLTRVKGLSVLLDAVRILEARKVRVHLDIYGSGEMHDECARVAQQMAFATVGVVGTLPYDRSFFEAITGYHAALVPNIGDEQPRIVYDAYCRAVPVIASNTAGLRDCVWPGETGVIVERENPSALADAIQQAQEAPEELRPLGLGGLRRAARMTHGAMHARRAKILEEALFGRP